jgi:hypothetical protein
VETGAAERALDRTQQANSLLAKDPSLVLPEAARYVHLPGGHQESWADAFCNVIRDAYAWIAEGGVPEAKPSMLPTFQDGYRSTCLVEAMLKSHVAGGVWQRVEWDAETAGTGR